MKSVKWQRMLWPLLVMAALIYIILLAQRGIPMEARPQMLEYLASAEQEEQQSTGHRSLILYSDELDHSTDTVQVLQDVMDSMRLPWHKINLSQEAFPDLEQFENLFVCTQDLSAIAQDAQSLFDWIERGGRMALMMAPQDNTSFQIFYRKLGICEYAAGYLPFSTFRYTGDLMPLWTDGQVYDAGGSMHDYALAARLEPDCVVQLQTGDQNKIPLLWTRDVEKGRVAVSNNTLILGKDSRGLALSVILSLEDTVVYPILNAGMVFIDDFPAPQPEGTNERLLQQFGYNIQGFFRNHWWPDMKELTWKYGLRYSGVLIETYNDHVTGPFEPDVDEHALIRYYASELLQSGGEIGLHGYNHMPLCLDGFPYSGEDYNTWPSTENMRQAIMELYRYGCKFLPSVYFKMYVPPSNYLSAEGQETLLKTLPQIRTISGLYLPEDGVQALTQEFEEEEDGSISVPRITSGFSMDAYNQFVTAQELLLHGTFSHFIHPDDVLDEERGAALGWTKMYEDFTRSIDEISTAYPQLRWSTASEGAAAVQRYDRLSVQRKETDDWMEISLTPFYDEAWLALRTEKPILSIDGGTLYPLSQYLYWIDADSDTIRINWGAEQ